MALALSFTANVVGSAVPTGATRMKTGMRRTVEKGSLRDGRVRMTRSGLGT
jgi:hypothetical protein